MVDILKFNNQYLKCIITKYLSTPQLLANSGSLIIYHPENSLDYQNDNYMYLGNEFLASGYGFQTQEIKNEAESIVNNYNNTIDDINNSIIREAQLREEKLQELNDSLKNYITKTGSIDNTTITIDNQIIPTKDILIYGEEAKYENLKINDINIKINNIELTGNTIYMPLGEKITSIEIDIDYDINDSGGIDKIEVIHKNLYNDFNEDESIVVEYDLDDNGNSKEGHIKYSKSFTNNDSTYILNQIDDIISEFYIYVKETPIYKYKNYPRIKDIFDLEIKSIGNIISCNKISVIKHINIIPVYKVFYGFENIDENLSLTINKSNEIDIITQDNKDTLYIAIPKIYYIDKLWGVNNENEKYNWTGALAIKDDLINKCISENIFSIYQIYKLTAINSSICKKIKVNISLIDKLIYNDITINEQTESNVNLSGDYSTNVNDEEFNSLYWVNLKNINNKEQIEQILNTIAYNCT